MLKAIVGGGRTLCAAVSAWLVVAFCFVLATQPCSNCRVFRFSRSSCTKYSSSGAPAGASIMALAALCVGIEVGVGVGNGLGELESADCSHRLGEPRNTECEIPNPQPEC